MHYFGLCSSTLSSVVAKSSMAIMSQSVLESRVTFQHKTWRSQVGEEIESEEEMWL